MADNQQNNKQDNIFQGVLDAINGGKKRVAQIPGTPTSFVGTVTDNSIENIQQQFLDWQVNKMAHNLYQKTLYFDTDRLQAYQDYRAMDMSPEIAAALNIIRDEALTRSAGGDIIEIYSDNSRIKEVIKDLLHKRLSIEFNAKLWIRDLVKYGDYFVHLHIDKDEGIYDFQTLRPEDVHREDGYDGKPGAVRFRYDMVNEYFEEWQIAHFRLIEDTMKIPYGRSILDPARKLWKQLQLAEDSMLVYRITRAPERRVFYIEVGNLEDGDVKTYVQKIQNQLKKQPIVDSRTGNINMKYNPMNITEDYFIPIRGDKSSRIDTLPGASNLSDIQDIEYLQNKLFASLQVPKAYLNYAESMPGGSTLSQADLRFARTINGIQEIFLMELRRIVNIHLYFAGFKDDIDNFTLTLTNPSTQQELLKLETQKARLEVANEYYKPDATSFTSWTWVMENILGFSKQEIKLILKQKKIEKKIFAEIDSGVDTYKKIGLFADLDAKYEIPGAVAKPSEETGGDMGGGGGGATSSLLGGGGMDMGAGLPGEEEIGGEELGGTPGAEEVGAETPETPTGETEPEEAPLSEGKNRLLKKLLKESDDRFGNYLDDLLGEDKKEEVDSILINNNKKLNFRTKKLFERIQNSIDSIEKEETEPGIIQEKIESEKDTLFTNNEKLINQTQDMMTTLENLFKPKIVSEVVDDFENSDNPIFEEENIDVENHLFETEIEDSQNNLFESSTEDVSENKGVDELKNESDEV
jgi:hypothetical protein